MSLVIVVAFATVTLLVVLNARQYDPGRSAFANLNFFVLVGYSMLLVLGLIACLGVGIVSWLKHGAWISVSPSYLASVFGDNGFLRALVTEQLSWLGVQRSLPKVLVNHGARM